MLHLWVHSKRAMSCLTCTFLEIEGVLVTHTQLDKAAKAISIITKDLIAEKKPKCSSPYLDIVGQVINFIPVRWLSNNIVRCLESHLRSTSTHSVHLDRAPAEE
jgi:hypothetical protein